MFILFLCSLHASVVYNKLVSEYGVILVSLVEGEAAATCKSRTCSNGDDGELKLKWSS